MADNPPSPPSKPVRQIQLSQGRVALVDEDDFETLKQSKWSSHRKRNTFYAITSAYRPDGVGTKESMHRRVFARILGRRLATIEQVDHVNGDGLDNRRENLRLATKAQNGRNCRKHADAHSSRK